MDMTRFRHSLAALAAAALACAAPAALAAQNPAPAPSSEAVDRIIAVVGDSIVTDMDLQEDLVRLREQGQLPKDPTREQLEAIRRQLLEGRVNDLILVQAALRDTTLKVSQDQVTAKAQQQLDAIQKNFVSPEAFNQALAAQRTTQSDLLLQYEAAARRNLLIQAYIDKLQRDRKPPTPTEDQMKKFFDESKAAVGQRPATVTFHQIVVAAQPSDAAKKVARAQADSILAKIRAGEDFAGLAKHYSQDPGTREKGGDLGWFRRESMVRAFADAAYAMLPGEVSGIVESPYGYHIIKLEKIRGAERSARHILIKPEVSPEDTVLALHTAQEVAQKLKDGTVSYDSLVARYNDPTEEQTKVGPYPKDKLPPPYDSQLSAAKQGEVVGPFRLTGDSPAKWAVVKVDEVKPAGEYSLSDPDTRQQVRDQVQRQLLMDEIIGELKQRTYVEIRS